MVAAPESPSLDWLLRSPVSLEELGHEAEVSIALAQATGRWPGPDADPTAYVPGDIVALRGFVTSEILHRQEESTVVAQLLHDAANFYVPAMIAARLATANLPKSAPVDARLPTARMALWLPHPFEMPGQPDSLRAFRVDAVFAFATQLGRLHPTAFLIGGYPPAVTNGTCGAHPWRTVATLPLGEDQWSSIVYALVELAAFGTWSNPKQPQPLPGEADGISALFKGVKGVFTRRAEKAGRFVNLRVLKSPGRANWAQQ